MSNLKVTTRYAKSILELANEQGKLEPVYADFLSLKKAMENRDLENMVKSPIISAAKKNSVFEALFGGSFDPLTISYLKLLTLKSRESDLRGIVTDFIAQYKALKGVTSVRLISAAPLTEAVINDIRTKLLASDSTAQSLDIETIIDPSLIGGFVVEFNDKRYDASIASKLVQMKDQFKENLFVKAI